MVVPGGGHSAGKRIEAKGNAIPFWSPSHVAIVVKNPSAKSRDMRDAGFHLWVGKIPWRRAWQATHSSILAWKIPWTEEPGRLWSIGSQRVGHD